LTYTKQWADLTSQTKQIYKSTCYTLNTKFKVVFKTIEWSSFFPVNKNYDFVEPNSVPDGWDIHNFIFRFMDNNLPVRIVVTNDNRRPVLNMLASIDNYSFREDAVNDIQYSIRLTEFTLN